MQPGRSVIQASVRSSDIDHVPAQSRARAAVTRLTLTDFRCYARLRVDVAREPVVLTGPNGAGKTNLLEALSFLAPGKGLRRAKLVEPDRRVGAEAAGVWAVAATVESGAGTCAVGTGREAGSERRSVRIDGTARSQKDLSALLGIVWLTPEMDRLFMEGPSGRRRFLDRLVFGFDPEHAGRVAAYEHCLRERARLLAEGGGDPAWLDALEDGMARNGVAVAAARVATVARLDQAAAEGIGPFPAARLGMAGELDLWLANQPALAVEDRLRDALRAGRGHDAQAGGAIAGPHRADLAVRFAPKDRAASECSTGEQKVLLLSIVIAVARELIRERGEPPVLLLDEVVAHLDGARRAALFDELAALGVQAWLTGTDDELFAGLRGRAQFFRVLDATLTPR
jgi:DNA replication and repair protein RecF